jgi:prepilin-type N-terminal cleavage/methylation domain-containing protein
MERKAKRCTERHGATRTTGGFTLVELMVVLAIIVFLTALAIPGLARLGAFSRDEFRRTVQEVSALLRSAQIYSTTYNVNTAVVYSMDNWSGAELTSGVADFGFEPVVDTVSGVVVRQFEAAAVMYQLPSGAYTPIPDPIGDFTPFPQDMAIMLSNPEDIDPLFDDQFLEIYYHDEVWSNFQPEPVAANFCICGMGLSTINADLPAASGVLFPAHVFRSSGRMSLGNPFSDCPIAPALCDRERFSIYIAPHADRSLEERLVQPEIPAYVYDADSGPGTDWQPNLLYRELHVFKSTGRTEVPKNF